MLQVAPALADPDLWVDLPEQASERAALAQVARAPSQFRAVRFNLQALRGVLRAAEARGMSGSVVIPLPMPDGSAMDFAVSRSSVLPAELARKYPDIEAFEGTAVVDPSITLRMEITPRGVSAQVLAPGRRTMIDPRLGDQPEVSISYYSEDLSRSTGEPFCEVQTPQTSRDPGASAAKKPQASPVAARSSGASLRTYRLAVATTGEYGSYHGGTVGGALSAVVTTINRVDGIYEKEMAISLELVANNDLVIYVNPATDPFTGNNSAGTLINESQAELDSTLGSGNYDIGHTFSTGAGGLAGLGVVCTAGQKGRGVTGRSNPIGDAYDVDYVAHEIGHQFDGNHTFNGANGSCSGGNRNASTAYEPGSGSTIQAYAGICSIDNLQANSDPIFHSESFDEMYAYASEGNGSSCGVVTATGNTAPSVDAGSDYTVPAGTPLLVTGSATDADGDSLTYLWEQRDLGGQAALAAPDDGAIPLFRVYEPVASPIRYLPQLASVVSGSFADEEKLPTRSRSMVLRLTARDGQGGVSSDDITVTVDGDKGPFQLIAPNGGETLGATATVTWDVAGTDAVPVSTDTVEFYLSTDGGTNFDVGPFGATSNTGSATVAFPAGINTATARLMIRGQNNIYYDVSDAVFSLNSDVETPPEPVFLVNLPDDSGAAVYFAPGADNGTAVTGYEGLCTTEDSSATESADSSPSAVIDGSAVVSSTVNFTPSRLIQAGGLSVTVDITHAWRGDLALSLLSPSGTSVALKNANLSDNANDVVGTFPATLAPAESLDTFAGENAQGVWTLQVNDTYPSADDGVLNSWGIEVETTTSGVTSSASASDSPLMFTGMSNGEEYTCTFNATGTSYDSTTVSAGTVTPGAATDPPGQPVITSVTGEEGALVVQVTAGGGPPPDTYRVVCGSSDSVTATGTVTVTGLTDGDTYACYAIATSGGEESVPSVAVSGEAGELPAGLPIWLLYEATQ